MNFIIWVVSSWKWTKFKEWWRSHLFSEPHPIFVPIPKLNRSQASARVEKVLLSNVPWAMKAVVLKSRVTTCQALQLVFTKPRVTQYLRCLTNVNMVTTLWCRSHRHVYNIYIYCSYIILHYKVWKNMGPMQQKYTCGLEGTTTSFHITLQVTRCYKYLDLDPSSHSNSANKTLSKMANWRV